MTGTTAVVDRRALVALGRATAEVVHEGNQVLTAMGLNLQALHKAAAGDPRAAALIGSSELGRACL